MLCCCSPPAPHTHSPNHFGQCLELDFRKPTAQQVSARMMQVCKNEGLDINDATLQTLAQGSQCDIRLVLGQLQVGRLSW